MAETPTSVAINIGSQRISMAVFEVSKSGGLLLRGYDSEMISADPALDASRIAQTRVAIGDLAKRLKVAKSKVRYAISGQAAFTRFVKLPQLQDDNIEQLVTFEAQQHVPFPLNEVVWDYEIIEGAVEKEVVLVAIKGDSLDEINAAVNESELGTIEVDCAPMAIYNAFRSTYGQLEEPVLLIDIGAKTSNLLYIEGRRFFTRSIPVGGSSITAAIAKEYNVSFNDAEHQKISNGLVALGGGHTEQLDEAVAALAMVIRNALGRLPAEIARTTNYYRSQHGGSAPRRILLAGGGANLPYTLEFFQEKLNLPVEYFNPVRNLAIGKGVDPAIIQREGHLMGELVGLGLRGIGKSEINIDLVPAVVEQTRVNDRRKPFLVAAAAVLLGGMALWVVFQNVAAAKASDLARTMADQRDALAPLEAEIKQLLDREKEMREIAAAYVDLESDHALWMDLLAELRAAFASDAVWITDFEPVAEYNPLQAVDPNAGPAAAAARMGRPVIRAEFAGTSFGNSSIVIAEDGPLTANAVRIRGFWRENPRSHNVVSDLLERLRRNGQSSLFRFALTGPNDQEVTLSDEQILEVTVTGEPGDLGLPFEITLPLAREVAFR